MNNVVAKWMDDPDLCTKEKMESLLTAYQILALEVDEEQISRPEAIRRLYSRKTPEWNMNAIPTQDWVPFLSVTTKDVENLLLKVGKEENYLNVKEVKEAFEKQQQVLIARSNFKEIVELYKRLLVRSCGFRRRHKEMGESSSLSLLRLDFEEGVIKASIHCKKREHVVLQSPKDLPKLEKILKQAEAFLAGEGKRRMLQKKINAIQRGIDLIQKRADERIALRKKSIKELLAKMPK